MENIPTVHYSAGEIIFREGEPSNNVFLIVGGKVKITKSDGNEGVLLATQGKGTIFGEMTLIDGKHRSATVTAMEDTYCHKCNSVALLKEIQALPQDLRTALQSMASIIRKKNHDLVAHKKKIPEGVIIDDLHPDDDIMSEEEINHPLVQDRIQKINNAFIRSLFRVLMAKAFNA
jgi:CRP-like cAMP-binding protein